MEKSWFVKMSCCNAGCEFGTSEDNAESSIVDASLMGGAVKEAAVWAAAFGIASGGTGVVGEADAASEAPAAPGEGTGPERSAARELKRSSGGCVPSDRACVESGSKDGSESASGAAGAATVITGGMAVPAAFVELALFSSVLSCFTSLAFPGFVALGCFADGAPVGLAAGSDFSSGVPGAELARGPTLEARLPEVITELTSAVTSGLTLELTS